ncbi:MAG: tetratricopeptide (TPR) repeat protein [Planctomycetota bacterium]|jgi:tetratricopeptide (TPR) repeat protein
MQDQRLLSSFCLWLPLWLCLVLCASCASTVEPSSARLYPGYGGYHRQITTDSKEAQRWFDQGLQLVYGFNHDEALRSFRQATKSDPNCALAWWGVAYANGIDVNDGAMSEEDRREAFDAAQEALGHLDGVTQAERAIVEAIAERYTWPAPDDRVVLDENYASAMAAVWEQFPGDADIAALYAESLMVLQPWDYWTVGGEPVKRTNEIVATLESAMLLDSAHPGANHFYIHAVEASSDPARAVAAADRLIDLVPGSGHLVHMPSHVYINVGRYADAAAANERAIRADEAYFALAPAPDFYNLYYIHNIHFLAFAAMMDGRFEMAMDAARQLEANIPAEFLEQAVTYADGLMPTTFHVMVRFGRWEDIIAEPEYPEFRKTSRAVRHYARAIALANLKRCEEARGELDALDILIEELQASEVHWSIGINAAPLVLTIARKMAEGEIYWNEGSADAAYGLLREAVAMEDNLVYDEPPGWMQPIRHALGALLLLGGRNVEAEKVYRFDLEDNPENAWSLLGLDRTLRAQGRPLDADLLSERLEEAWARSDVNPGASCYCGVTAELR